MAVAPSSAGRTVPLFVLIIFIVLFLGAVTGLVLLFVHQETVRQDALNNNSKFETYMGSMLTTKLDAYKAAGGRSNKTAVANLLDERNKLARLLTGSEASMSKEAEDKLAKAVASLPKSSLAAQKLKDITQADLIGALQQAALLLKNQMDEITALQGQLADCQKARDTVTAGYKDLEDKFKEKTDQFTAALAELQKVTDSVKKDFTDQIETVKTQVSKELRDQMDQRQKQNLVRLDELRDLVRRNLASLIASTRDTGMGDAKSAAMMTVDQLTQKTDAEVIDVAGPVLYVGLGSKQNVKAGLRFCVISPTQVGQVAPRIKAVIEVTKTGDMTSECRVVMSLLKDPILRGDPVLNLAFDREQALTFLVFGDFDLYGTGVVDPNAAQKIAQIITLAGGKVVHQLTPSVHFAIVGQPPVGMPTATTGAAATEAGGQPVPAAAKTYSDLKDQIQALSIPTISTDIFVKYTGFAQNLDK